MARRLSDKIGVSKADLAKANPMQRIAHPSQITAATLWLLSDDASFINGQALSVDGGQSAGIV
jgi:NAD(P)-dependent dehydrogenase (short-subunit alcohol dehydrogenase family)